MHIADFGWVRYSQDLAEPIRVSFGTMTARHLVLVIVELDDGTLGIGETWTNFPAWAPSERTLTLDEGLRPLVQGREVGDVTAFTRDLLDELAPLARHWGAWGPVYQAVSGLDIALWDAVGRRAGVSVAELVAASSGCGDAAVSPVSVYASGLGPTHPVETAARLYAAGVRTFKLKVGFGLETDSANLHELRRAYPDAAFAIDANQAWTLDEATRYAPLCADFACLWVEEPLATEMPGTLAELARQLPCPIAFGENAYGLAILSELARWEAVQILQPDVTKTGGISTALDVYAVADEHALTVAPHFLGGAVGQAASAHLVAGRDPDGLLEMDANPNPFRHNALRTPLSLAGGALSVPSGPGLGVDLDVDWLRHLLVSHSSGTGVEALLCGEAGVAGETHGVHPFDDAWTDDNGSPKG